jgi:hypothetical protein
MADLSELSDDELRQLRLQSMTDEELRAAQPSLYERTLQGQQHMPEKIGEGVLSVLSSIPAAAAGGLHGIWEAAGNGPPGSGAQAVQDTVNALTYQPRSLAGQRTVMALSAIPELMSEGADWVGRGITRNMMGITRNPEGSAFAGAGANVLTNLAFMGLPLLGRARRPAVRAPQTVPLDQLTAERIRRAENVPVPVELTKGQATRDPQALRQEELIAQTDEGQAIRERHIEQNRAIIQNLDQLRERAGPKSAKPEDVGARVAGERQARGPEGALVMKERQSAENVDALYNRVRASPENNNPVDPAAVVRWIAENDSAGASVPAIRSIGTELRRRGALEIDEATGLPVASRPLTIGEMEDIRKLANKLSKPGDPSSFFMGDLKRIIDRSTENAGGDVYRAARRARLAHAMEFEEPRAIAQLLDSRSRTDRRVALEDVWNKTVVGGSVADLERVRSTLLDAPDRRVRDAGRKAWRDIAGNTVEYIKDEATKSVALDSSGNIVVSPAALKRALDRVGDKKLDVLLGKSSADQLRQVAGVAYDVKTMPPNKAGSTTVSNFMSMMDGIDKHIGKVPLIGSTARGAIQVVRELGKSGARLKMTEEALNFPPQANVAQPSMRLRDIGTALNNAGRLSVKYSPALGLQLPQEQP